MSTPSGGLSCPSPVITSVNGRASGAVFTPQLGHNHYRIEGCGFGNTRGEVRLVADPSDAAVAIGPINLLPEGLTAWSDREIDVRLDPRLSGIPDSTAALVVQLADGGQVQLSGCRFIAVRAEPVALKILPASWVVFTTAGGNRPLPQLEFVSPPIGGEEIPRRAENMSALVIRSDSKAFEGGSDTYDLSALNPGWLVESIRIQKYAASCPGDVTRTSDSGEWSTTFHESGFTLRWASTTCSSFIPPRFQFGMSWSEYAIKLWLTGPVGTEPLRKTGLKSDEQK